jgi:hypothetical protein
MCYVDWMKEDWEVQLCEGTTDLQTQYWLKFLDEPGGKKIVYQTNAPAIATDPVWANGISYFPNGDIVTGQHNGCNFKIERNVPVNGDPAELICTISGDTSGSYSALVGGGSAGFLSALLALFGRPLKALKTLKAPRQRRARVHYAGGGPDSGGGSWTALEGGLT